VLGRIRESSPEDSILLTIFAAEREDSIQMSRNRFRIATNPKPKRAKNTTYSPNIGIRMTKTSILNLILSHQQPFYELQLFKDYQKCLCYQEKGQFQRKYGT
jgi:hypothetical protein